MNVSDGRQNSLRDDSYVSWNVFPAEHRGGGIGATKPMGLICAYARDDSTGERIQKIVNAPSDVIKRLAALKKNCPKDSVIRYGELSELIIQVQRQVAKERVLRLLNRRDYSRHELEERLRRDGFEHETCTEVIDELAACGIVSDSRFAEVYIRSKLNVGWGIERIVRELERRGVDVNELVGWPYDYLDPDDEIERAVAVAQKKCSGSRMPTYQQLVRFLMGRGFSCGVACGAAKQVI